VPLYKLIKILKEEQQYVRSTIESRIAGGELKSKKYKQQQLDKRLLKFVAEYDEKELHEFVVELH
jgi:hypothetical protein